MRGSRLGVLLQAPLDHVLLLEVFLPLFDRLELLGAEIAVQPSVGSIAILKRGERGRETHGGQGTRRRITWMRHVREKEGVMPDVEFRSGLVKRRMWVS